MFESHHMLVSSICILQCLPDLLAQRFQISNIAQSERDKSGQGSLGKPHSIPEAMSLWQPQMSSKDKLGGQTPSWK